MISFSVPSWFLYDLANQFNILNILSVFYLRWIVLKHNIPETILALLLDSPFYL